jgi:tetratricopeptide (TPR) repeat protein
VALDPTSAFNWIVLGNVFAFAGMRDSAIAASLQALKLDSTMVYPYWVQMHGYLDSGRRADADRAAERMRGRASDDPAALAFVAGYYRRVGNRAAAQEILNHLDALARHRYVPPSAIGAARLAAGDRAGALDALEEAALNRDLELTMRLVLSYSPLKGDPRYEAVARKVFGGRPVPHNPFP